MKTGHASNGMPRFSWVYAATLRCGFTREYGGGGNGERLVKLASRAGPFAGEPAPTCGLCPTTDLCPPPIRCRSGFTREYRSSGNGERLVEIGQQVRPFRG